MPRVHVHSHHGHAKKWHFQCHTVPPSNNLNSIHHAQQVSGCRLACLRCMSSRAAYWNRKRWLQHTRKWPATMEPPCTQVGKGHTDCDLRFLLLWLHKQYGLRRAVVPPRAYMCCVMLYCVVLCGIMRCVWLLHLCHHDGCRRGCSRLDRPAQRPCGGVHRPRHVQG